MQQDPLMYLIIAIVSLFGWLLKRVIDNYIKTNKDLVEQNQKNVENFVNTINHQQTKFNASIDKLSENIGSQTEVFKQLIKEK